MRRTPGREGRRGAGALFFLLLFKITITICTHTRDYPPPLLFIFQLRCGRARGQGELGGREARQGKQTERAKRNKTEKAK
jgi:hypothetical protein